MNHTSSGYAIVTGASQGLGRALAGELASRGHNLLLAALPGTGLPELSASLGEKHNVSVKYFEADLMCMETPGELLGYVRSNNLDIDILINNVGIGHGGDIGNYSDQAIDEMVFLNMRCATLMTNTFVAELMKSERSYILNVGSLGGFQPVPFKSIYSATKSYIYHFSLAIREELRDRGVVVSVAMPGGIITNQKVRERINALKPLARKHVLEPEEAAVYLINRLFLGRRVIIPGRTTRLAFYIGSLLPYRVLMAVTGKIFRGVN